MGSNIDQSTKRIIIKNNQIKIFAIPGLGVDGRIYQRLSSSFSPFEIIEWLEPHPNESLSAYSSRMAKPIRKHGGPALLMGTSFGGMVAQEIAQIEKLEGLILLSTFKHTDQKPWYYPIAAKIPIYHLMKGKLRYQLLPYWAPLVGIREEEEQNLLQEMFMEASTKHRLWGAGQIVHWQPPELTIPYVHIHGQQDRVFPIQNIHEAEKIEGAGHFMVYQQADLVAQKIETWFDTLPDSINPSFSSSFSEP